MKTYLIKFADKTQAQITTADSTKNNIVKVAKKSMREALGYAPKVVSIKEVKPKRQPKPKVSAQ